MRVSDLERQRTIDELRRHCAAGRIDVDEYGRRIEQAMGASTLGDLDALLADLPMLRIADPSGRPGRARREGRADSTDRADRADRALRAGGRRDQSNHHGAGGDPVRAGGGRLASTMIVMVTVMVVLAAVLLIATVSWTWAAVLVVGWLAGLVQGAATRKHDRDRP